MDHGSLQKQIAVCADGTFLDSAVIFKAQNHQDSWFANMAGVPKDFLFGVSPSGWTDNSKALAWLEKSFGSGGASEKRPPTTMVHRLGSGACLRSTDTFLMSISLALSISGLLGVTCTQHTFCNP